ncbi:hypothetical protein LJ656_33855 [Paraburkholderia sp. MMS20-SJTR3]|uniref:Uncharacterized protein n=1 Tax=Paraburkholderia sejongensis TaxID=2886946 RepID=A0ABS8K5W6_9BURK|nr:hypothetical protein [Paraburkholderia sp. MMS20-SJTR3]MCC8397537.1 hypothetical protein [Paraburkholderia sp. MMS20-SJTR3]
MSKYFGPASASIYSGAFDLYNNAGLWSAMPPKENMQKGLDGVCSDLHNLASSLMTQRRKTKQRRVVEVMAQRVERIDL